MKVGETADDPLGAELARLAAADSRRASVAVLHADTSPEAHAEALRLAERVKAPPAAVVADPAPFRRDAARQELDKLATTSPIVASWAEKPDHYAVSKDDLPAMQGLEGVFRTYIDGETKGDTPRSIVGGGVIRDFLGSSVAGIGRLWGAAGRNLQQPTYGDEGDEEQFDAQLLGAAVLEPLGEVLQGGGEKLKEFGAWIAPPPERQSFVRQVQAGLGQIAGQVATGGAGEIAMFGQGADIAGTRAEAAGASQDQVDSAAASGGLVTAASERLGMGLLMRRAPAWLRRGLRAKAADVALGGLGEGTQEVIEGVGHDFVARQYDPSTEIGQGIANDFSVAGAVGLLARAALHTHPRVRAIEDSTQGADFLEGVQQHLEGSKVPGRSPAALAALVEDLRDAGAPAHAFIGADDFVQLFQSPAEAYAAASQYTDLADGAAFEAVLEAGGDLAIPIAKAAQLLASPVGKVAVQKMKVDPGHMTVAETRSVDREAESQLILQELQAVFQRPATTDAGTVEAEQDILGELVASGRYAPGDAAAMAQLLPRFYSGLARAKGVDVAAVRKQYPVSVISDTIADRLRRRNPNAESAAITPILDAIRTGKVPSMAEAYGPSLVTQLVKAGGIQDFGGELRSIDATRRPGLVNNRAEPVLDAEGNVVSPAGMPLDTARAFARERGFFPPAPENAPDELEINDLLELVDRDLREGGVHSSIATNPDLAALRANVEAWSRELPSLLGVNETMSELLALSNQEILERARRAAVDGYVQGLALIEPGAIENGGLAESLLPESKAVDANGRLLTLYHGGTFDASQGDGIFELPAFFTADRKGAESYLGWRHEEERNTTAVHLDVRNPATDEDIRSVVLEVLKSEPDLFPYDAEELQDMPAFEFISPNLQDGAREVIAQLQARGFDGAHLSVDFYADGYPMMESWVAFNPDQIMSADHPGVYYQDATTAPPFRSALVALVDAAQGFPKKAEPSKWIELLDGAQRRGMIRQAERDWMGLDDWLKGQESVTRAELQEFVRSNQLEVTEVVEGRDRTPFDVAMLDNLPFKVEARPGGDFRVRGSGGVIMSDHESADAAEQAAYHYSIGQIRAQGGRLPWVGDRFQVERVDQQDVDDFGLDDSELGAWAIFDKTEAGTKGEYIADLGDTASRGSYARAVHAAVVTMAEMEEGAGIELGQDLPGAQAPYSSMVARGPATGYRVMKIALPAVSPIALQRFQMLEGARAEMMEARSIIFARSRHELSAEEVVRGDELTRNIDAIEKELRDIDNRGRFLGGHWSDSTPNTMMHIRFDERLDADGKRVLFINELQSDWHQKARKSRTALIARLVEGGATEEEARAGVPADVGYKGAADYSEAEIARFTIDDEQDVPRGQMRSFTVRDAAGSIVAVPSALFDTRPDEVLKVTQQRARDGQLTKVFRPDTSKWTAVRSSTGTWTVKNGAGMLVPNGGYIEAASAEEAIAAAAPTASPTERVPDAPFKTTWLELGLKRMVRWAAENGFDRVSWPREDQVPVIEQWPMTAPQIRADTSGSRPAARVYGAILDRYAQDVPRAMKALGKPHGAEVVESDLNPPKPKPKPGDGRWTLHEDFIDDAHGDGDLAVVSATGEVLLRTGYDSAAHQLARDNPGSRVLPWSEAEQRMAAPPAAVGGALQSPPPHMVAMDDAELQVFAGATEFSITGHPPISGEFDLPDGGSVMVIASGEGVEIMAHPEDGDHDHMVQQFVEWPAILALTDAAAEARPDGHEADARAVLALTWNRPGFAELFGPEVAQALRSNDQDVPEAPAGWGVADTAADAAALADEMNAPPAFYAPAPALPLFDEPPGRILRLYDFDEPSAKFADGSKMTAVPLSIEIGGTSVDGHLVIDGEHVNFFSLTDWPGMDGPLHLWKSLKEFKRSGEQSGLWTSGFPHSAGDAARMIQRLWQDQEGFWLRGWDSNDVMDGMIRAAPAPVVKGPTNLALEINDKLRAAAMGGMVLFQEGRGDARGSIQFPRSGVGEGAQSLIRIAETADQSTFLHELGHFYLEVLSAEAAQPDAPANLRADFLRILKWFGVEDLSAWHMMGVEARRPFHEQFARGFEKYLGEGKAPAPGLKGAFRKFRSWIRAVYNDLSALNVDLTDDVRQVFDRMLASEEEIAAATAEQGLVPALPPGSELGLPADVLEKYRSAMEAARESLEAKVLNAKFREQRAGYRAEVRAERERVAQEVETNPVYVLLDALRGGPVKLDRAELAGKYGEAVLPRLRGLYAPEGGSPMEAVADLHSYPTGEAMIDAILNAPPKAEFIRAEAAARVRERHGDPLTDGSVPQLAIEALHNGRMAKALDAEIAALAHLAGKPRPKSGELAGIARQLINSQIGRSVQPHQHLVAERKAANAAAKAAAAGDFGAALVAKRQQALNAALFVAAKKARDDMDRLERRAKRLSSKAGKERMAAAGADAYYDRVQDILAAYEFRRVPAKTVARRASLRSWVEGLQAAGDVTALTNEILERVESERVINWQDVPVSEIRAVDEALANIEHLAGLKNKLLAGARAATKAEAIALMRERAETMLQLRGPDVVDKGDLTRGERLIEQLRSLTDAITRPEWIIEALDGGEQGPFHDFLWRPQVDAENAKIALMARIGAAIKSVHAKLPEAFQDSLNAAVVFRGVKMRRYALLSAAFNLGNAGNRQRLRDGGITTSGGTALRVDEAALVELSSLLTATEWGYVQSMWDVVGSLGPDIEALQRELGGVPLTFVQPVPLSVTTVDGKSLQLRGGYWPLVYHTDRSAVGERQEGDDAMKILMQAGQARAATSKGHTKERVEELSAALRLNFGDILSRSFDHVMTDLAYRKAVRDISLLLKDQEFKAFLIGRIGRSGYDAINGGLAYSVSGGADVAGLVAGGWRAAMDWTAANFVVSALAIRPDIALGNYSSAMVQGLTRVERRYLFRGLRKLMLSRDDVTTKIVDKSPMMRDRLREIDHGYREQLRQTRDFEGRKGGFKVAYFRVMMTLHRFADHEVSRALWWGRYEQALAEGALERDAIELADTAVRMTQTAAGRKDKSTLERDAVFRQSTSFMGPMYVQFGTLMAAARGQGATRQIGARYSQLMIAWVFAPALFALATGRAPDDDDKDGQWSITDWARWAGLNIGLYPLQTMPFARDLEAVAEAAATGKRVSPRQSPVSQSIDSLSRSAASLSRNFKDEAGDGIDYEDATADLIGASAPFVGLPGSQYRKSQRGVDYLLDNPDTGVLTMTELLLYGKPVYTTPAEDAPP